MFARAYVRMRILHVMTEHLSLYETYYVARAYEQMDLFALLNARFTIRSVLYAGSFVHISPSFIFPDVTYIDSDAQAKRFFSHEAPLKAYINARKQYPDAAFAQDYRVLRKELMHAFDLLISQYAGFISEACKPYLKVGGLLLVNNSHGDAGLAALDTDYELVTTVHKRNGAYRLSDTNLGQYFIPKRPLPLSKAYLQKLGKGVAYSKTATLYVFKRVS